MIWGTMRTTRQLVSPPDEVRRFSVMIVVAAKNTGENATMDTEEKWPSRYRSTQHLAPYDMTGSSGDAGQSTLRSPSVSYDCESDCSPMETDSETPNVAQGYQVWPNPDQASNMQYRQPTSDLQSPHTFWESESRMTAGKKITLISLAPLLMLQVLGVKSP